MEIEELVESACTPSLPKHPATSLPAFVLRRPREVDAICAGSASATAPAVATVKEAGGLNATSTTTGGPMMPGHWAAVERQLEEAHTARRHARDLEDADLASSARYLDEYYCGREIANVWTSRVQSLQEERQIDR